MSSAAASPFSGSVGFGYRSSCGRQTSKMLIMSNIGDHVWFMTSRQTDPDLERMPMLAKDVPPFDLPLVLDTHSSSMLGWNIRFVNPILGDLYGYESGSSTWTFQIPPSKGAIGY